MSISKFRMFHIFQSTPPARGATYVFAASNKTAAISIHAPREGGDDDGSPAWQAFFQFQSTPPARGATFLGRLLGRETDISIHAPREGGDVQTRQKHCCEAISIHAPREGGDPVLP